MLSTALPFLEVLRRTVWACFRLENEHLHNTRGYRQVSFVPLSVERLGAYSSRTSCLNFLLRAAGTLTHHFKGGGTRGAAAATFCHLARCTQLQILIC